MARISGLVRVKARNSACYQPKFITMPHGIQNAYMGDPRKVRFFSPLLNGFLGITELSLRGRAVNRHVFGIPVSFRICVSVWEEGRGGAGMGKDQNERDDRQPGRCARALVPRRGPIFAFEAHLLIGPEKAATRHGDLQ